MSLAAAWVGLGPAEFASCEDLDLGRIHRADPEALISQGFGQGLAVGPGDGQGDPPGLGTECGHPGEESGAARQGMGKDRVAVWAVH